MTTEVSADALITKHGMWGELETLPRDDWKFEVQNGDTNLGYWEWVAARLEAS